MNKKLFAGFSLTEVLIALAVIGIVAAFTVPVVISNYNRQTMQTLIQKNYIELEQNLTSLQSENIYKKTIFGSILCMKQYDSTDVGDTAGKFLNSYYKIKQDCGENKPQPCFAEEYNSIASATLKKFSCTGYSVKVAGGAAICIYPATVGYKQMMGPNPHTEEIKNPAKVIVDVNGADAPNIGGRDIFTFNIYSDYSIAEVEPTLDDEEKKTAQKEIEDKCYSSEIGEGCFTKLLSADWKMNY